MTSITVKFTMKELDLLSTLAGDQLFRREFIDSRLPGCKCNVVELNLGKQLVQRLKMSAEKAVRVPVSSRSQSAV